MAELSRCYNKDCGTVRDASSRWEVQISSNSTCCVTTRHDNYSPCISAQEKAVTCYIALVGQHGATRRTRQARPAQHVSRGVATYSVDWGEHVHLIFSRSYSWDWCKSRAQNAKVVHVSTTAYCRPPCWNKHGATRTTRRACRVVTWRNKWNLSYTVKLQGS